MYQINIQKISQPITVFNIDGTSNKAGQISETVDIVLQYKTYLEWILLVVSSLGKQDLILGYFQLKYHNPEVNWEKEEVEITYYPSRYDSYRDLQKVRRVEEHIIATCQSKPFPRSQKRMRSQI